MTFNEILLKLLPFTYVDDQTEEVAFGSWSALSDGDRIITFVEMLLFAIFIYALVRLAISWWKDRQQITLLTHLLEKYKSRIQKTQSGEHLDISQHYGALVNDINSADPGLSKLWREFDESLIKKRAGERIEIQNSVDAEYFFNKKTMISHVGSKLFAAIPGILLGIGLLGTFLGLYFALIQLNVGDADALQGSIKILINMAGVKFAASIWGLLLSIMFTFIDKNLEFGLDHKVDGIQTLINQIFVRRSAEQNLDSLVNESAQQTKALNELVTSLTDSIGNTFSEPLHELSDTVKHLTTSQAEQSHQLFASTSERLHRTFQEVLEKQTALASARDEKIAADLGEIKTAQHEMLLGMSDNVSKNMRDMNEKISANIERLVETLQQTSDRQINDTKQREERMNETHQSLVSSLAKSLQEDMRAMSSEVRSSVNTMVKTMDDLTAAQNESSARREEEQRRAQTAAMEHVSSSVSENMAAMNAQVSGNLEKLVAAIESSLSRQQSSSEERENQMTDGVQTLLQNIESTVARQLAEDRERNAVVTNMIQELSLQNKHLIAEISQGVSNQMSSLNNNSEQLFRKLIHQFELHVIEVKGTLEAMLGNLRTEVGNIDVIMSTVSQRLVGLPAQIDSVMRISDKLLTFSGELTSSTANMLQFNSDFLKTAAGLEGYIAKITDASEALKQADGNLKETLGISKEVMAQMKQEYQELADTNSDTVDRFAGKVDTFMNDYHRHVESAIKDKVIHQLDNALSAYAQTMAEAITNLSEAIDELREKKDKVIVYETV